MRVERRELAGTDMLQLFVAADAGPNHYVGESAGYLCPHCHAHDETLIQVVHEDGCPLFGEHGRKHYDSIPDVPDRFSAAIRPEHVFTIIRSNETDHSVGIYNGTVVGFRCDFCGNSDETVGEICHDENCPMAGEEGLTSRDILSSKARADGGESQ